MTLSPETETLLQTTLCRGLSLEETRSLVAIGEERRADAGGFLFREGDSGNCVFVILEGEVEILKRGGTGDEKVLARLSEGAVLGEMGLIAGGNLPRGTSARALRDVSALRIAATEFQQRIARDDVPALKVVHNFARIIARRLVAMNEQLVAAPAPAGAVHQTSEVRQTSEFSRFNQVLQDWTL